MENLPIEASVNEFVDLISKHTHSPVTCWACGQTEWDTLIETPVALTWTKLRLDEPGHDMGGMHLVPLVCANCHLVRFHLVQPILPPEDEA